MRLNNNISIIAKIAYLNPRFWFPSFQGRYVRILKSYA